MAKTTMYSGINNSPQTALSSNITATDTTIPVVSATAFPEGPNLATIGTEDDAEVIRYTSISGSSLTGCERGFGGTTARIWQQDTLIYRGFTKYDHDAFIDNIDDLYNTKLSVSGNSSQTTVAFTTSNEREKISTGEKLTVLLGKIAKWLSDLTTVAFSGKYADLSGTPTAFSASGSTAASGLVPTPSTTAGTTKYLREDATWAVPPNTTYSAATTSANGLMSSADKLKANYTNIAYGTCSTAAATAAKVITVSGNTKWALTAGSRITIKFSYTNTAQNPTFNVNSTGAKSVWYNTALITTSSLGYAGTANRPMDFVYDGTQYVFVGWSVDSNTTYSNFVKSGSSAKNGLVPAPSTTAGTTKYLREDATWVVPPNTTYSSFVKSGSTAASGLVPAPSTTAGTTKYLREDATWAVPPNTTYSAATTSANGLMSSADKTKLNGIATGATKNTISSTTATLTASGWSNNAQTVSVSGVTASNHVFVSPAATSFEAWGESVVRATAQASGTLTFACSKVPTGNLTANILILG